jgi:selenocysteine lyase/cysteine desulfurase
VPRRIAEHRQAEHHDPPALKRRLYDEHRIEVPIVETRSGWSLRVSVQAYNDEGDLRALASALA